MLLRCFSWRRATTAPVCARSQAGIAVGGIYNHFSSKEDIFRDLLESRSPYPKVIKTLQNLQSQQIEAGPDLVRVMFQVIPDLMLEHMDFIGLVVIDVQEFEGTTFRKLVSTFIPYTLGVVKQAQHKGAFRDDVHPAALMVLLAGTLFGYVLTVQYAMQGDDPILPPIGPDQWRDMLLSIYFNGVMAQEGKQ
jgi:AcrR family transcriptional regulator